MGSVLHLIGQRLPEMTKVHKRIAKMVLERPDQVIKMSISELTREAGARSESSVVRFYQFLGFTGYHDFKVSLATEVGGRTFYHSYEDIGSEDSVLTVKDKLFAGAAKTLEQNARTLNDEALSQAVEIIAGAERIILVGFAVSAAVAYDAYFKFTRLGYVCHFSTDAHINAVALSKVRKGDVLLVFSHSGETRDAIVPIRQARPTAKVVSITGARESSLARASDVTLVTTSEERNYGTDALVSRVVQIVLVSVVYTAVALKRGEHLTAELQQSRRSLSYLKF